VIIWVLLIVLGIVGGLIRAAFIAARWEEKYGQGLQ